MTWPPWHLSKFPVNAQEWLVVIRPRHHRAASLFHVFRVRIGVTSNPHKCWRNGLCIRLVIKRSPVRFHAHLWAVIWIIFGPLALSYDVKILIISLTDSSKALQLFLSCAVSLFLFHKLLANSCPDSMPVLTADSTVEERQWILYVEEKLDDRKAPDIPCPSIFMASSPLRGLKLEAFIPQVVAIGPYHSDLGPHHSYFPDNRETERYKAIAADAMEKHKVIASKKVAKTFRDGDFSGLIREVLKDISYVRSQYDVDLTCKLDEKLAYMLSLDASFVVEVLRTSVKPDYRSGFCAYYCSRFPRPLRKSILQDFVLLENQIPLSVLLKVISMDHHCQTDTEAESILASLVEKLALEVLPFHVLSEDSISSVSRDIRNRKHLLDCLYGMMTYGGPPGGMVEKPTDFPRALELHNCGVKFRPIVPGNTMSIKFDACKVILYLPKIKVGDDTEKLFRNLIAYESHLVENVHVLSYLRFMNSLVDTPEDVALLVKEGVIDQDIGSNEEVAYMWNNLCVNTMRVCSDDYEKVASLLLKHSKNRMNAWKAEFFAMYFSQPWLIVGVLSGGALLLMTVVIMYYTIKLYTKPGA